MTKTNRPQGFHSVTPYLTFQDGIAAMEWYAQALGGRELARLTAPDGTLAHAEFQLGDSRIMLASENLTWGNKSPQTLGGSPVALMLYVDDVDAAFENALAHGAIIKRPVDLQFYGDRTGTLVDPFGYQWTLATHVKEVSLEEMQRHIAGMATQA